MHYRIGTDYASKSQPKKEEAVKWTWQMIGLLASIAVGMQDSFTPNKSASVVVVLARPIDTRIQQGSLVNCAITKSETEYLEITCAD